MSYNQRNKEGKKEGPWVGYWENGKTNHIRIYLNGKLEGYSISYWSEGRVSAKGLCKNNKRIGFWTGYKYMSTIKYNTFYVN